VELINISNLTNLHAHFWAFSAPLIIYSEAILMFSDPTLPVKLGAGDSGEILNMFF